MSDFWGRFSGRVLASPAAGTAAPRPRGRAVVRGYVVAVLAAILSVLLRALLDPLLVSDYVFVLSLFAVMFVAWWCGLKPALLTLIVGMSAFVLLFMHGRYPADPTL